MEKNKKQKTQVFTGDIGKASGEKTLLEHNQPIDGFWTPDKPGQKIVGTHAGYKSIMTENGMNPCILLLCEDKGVKMRVAVFEAHELKGLEDYQGSEIEISYKGKENLDNGNSMRKFDISVIN